MEERKISSAYVNVLSAIKDQVAVNVSEQAKKRGLDAETTRIMIHAAQSTIDTVGINGFNSVFNAARQAAQEASNEKSSKR